MTPAVEIHPKLLKMRSCVARLINLVQPTYHAEGKSLGELYRVAVDCGVDLQADKELWHWHELFCDYHDQYDIDAVSSSKDTLENVCLPLAQWLAEGMSPAIHRLSNDGSQIGKSLLCDVLRSTNFSFSAEQLLGSLRRDEFCGYFANCLNLNVAVLPNLRKIVAVIPDMLNPVYWHVFSQAGQAQGAEEPKTYGLSDTINQWLPLLILDYTKKEALYKQAVAFFNPNPTIHLFKKLFGDGGALEDTQLIDQVVSLSLGGWGGEAVNEMMPYLLAPLPLVVIRPNHNEIRNENIHYLNFLIDKALEAIEDNCRVFWPVCLLTDVMLKNCGGLHASSSTEERHMRMGSLLKQQPKFQGIVEHLRKIQARDLNFRDVDIYNVQNQSIFIDLLTPAQKAEWVPSLGRKLAHSLKHSMQGGGWPHSLEKSKLMLEHIHSELKIAFSEELRSVVKSPSAYTQAKVIVWLQTLSLRGPGSADQALSFCHSITDPALKVTAAVELGIDPVTLRASQEEAALYLENDLGL